MSDDVSAATLSPEDIALPSPVARQERRAWLLAGAAPLAFLVTLAARYALTPMACGSVTARALLEITALLGVIAAAGPGYRTWRLARERLLGSSDLPGHEGSHRLLEQLTVLASAFFALLTLAIWIPSSIVSPCAP